MASTLLGRRVFRVFKRQLYSFKTHSRYSGVRLCSTSISESQSSTDSVCFSGIQPTSNCPHLGNYLGAIKLWVDLQEKYSSVIFSLVDFHSITVPTRSPDQLRTNLLDMTACLLACGINPEKCILFQQSQIPQHAELAWILGCLCSLPRLKHLSQWKEKAKLTKEPSLGLFTYPVLQAADILLYKSNIVPVGEDQVQNIELTRDLAHHFNRKYGKLFEKPNILKGHVAKVQNLRDPSVKMSKSEPNPLTRIDLTDSAKEIQMKIKKAQTDCISALTYEPDKRPGVSNLINIHSAISGLEPEQICKNLSDLDTGQYKIYLADVLIEYITPIQTEIRRLQADKEYLVSVLEIGRQKAAPIAEATMKKVKHLVGFTIS